MTNRFMVSVAALALIAGTGVAGAQGTKGEAGGSTMQHSAPAGNSASKSDSSTGAAKSEQGESSHGGMKSTQSEQKSHGAMKNDRAEDNVKGGSTSQRAEDRGKAGSNNQRAEEKSGNKSESRDNNMKAEGRDRDHDKNMKAEGRDRDRDSNMKAEGRDSKSGTNAAETKSTTDRSQTTTGQAGAGAKLTSEQRTKITTVIRNERVAPVNNANFSISVGTRVPREGITLHRLPSEVVTIYPEWRSYEYILVHNQIVVIDPGTYEIVAVLEA
jgi:hypothetical protein